MIHLCVSLFFRIHSRNISFYVTFSRIFISRFTHENQNNLNHDYSQRLIWDANSCHLIGEEGSVYRTDKISWNRSCIWIPLICSKGVENGWIVFPFFWGQLCKSISGDIGVGEPHTKNAFRRSFVRRFRILAFQIDIQSGRAGDPLSPLGGRGGVGGLDPNFSGNSEQFCCTSFFDPTMFGG